MLKYILPVIPEHDTYVEPFAGGLAVFLAKERVKVEVINDLNDEVSLFYLYVREHPDALISEIEWYLHSVEIFNRLMKNKGLTELQKVAAGTCLGSPRSAGLAATTPATRGVVVVSTKQNMCLQSRSCTRGSTAFMLKSAAGSR